MTNPALSYTVTYGGWYQRTTLHMSEVYDLLAHAKSSLALDPSVLSSHREALDLSEVSRESGYLEYVLARTRSGIEIRYYEDGLYVLTLASDNIASAHETLETYYDTKLNPAISYIFSLGAPTPKILANIKTIHPTVVSVRGKGAADFVPDTELFGEVYTRLERNGTTVFRTPKYICIAGTKISETELTGLVEMQIFFREFKDQLEKYLNIHRTIWEEISEIKEGEQIAGSRVDEVRGKLDDYQKTISLIENRMNQMGSYVSTRSSIAKHLQIEEEMVLLFEYKFETLADTLSYIKEIWKMTSAYLTSAIQNLVEIKNQTTSNNLKSLQTITSIGVISGVLGYLSSKALPEISSAGIIYFIILFVLTWILNFGISTLYKNKKYSLKFGNRANL